MREPISTDEFCKLFGLMFEGMLAPGGLGMLGKAAQPWAELKDKLNLFGYPTIEECERAAGGVIDRAIAEARKKDPLIGVGETLLQLVRTKYGNLDPDVNKYVKAAERIIAEAKGKEHDGNQSA